MSKEADTLKQLEAELAASKEFVNLAAHQLQEPLASMKWQMDTLLADRAGSLKPKQRVIVEELYAVNQDAIRLVKDLLFVARLEGGRLKIDKQATNLVALLDQIKKRYEPAVNEYRGVLHFDSPRGAIPQVAVDARMLTQAVDNLLSNAIKYNPTDTHIDLGLKQEEKHVVVSVRNRGPGIPEDKQKQLFEKFSRAEAAGTKKTGGTGLGLYITKQIVELHGGEISFTSTPGKGATFFIKLPLT
jgi:signal transduction histidine kinase